jgi:hypothetical protein
VTADPLPAQDALGALTFLEDHGYVRRQPDPDASHRGRKPVAYEVHPKAHDDHTAVTR